MNRLFILFMSALPLLVIGIAGVLIAATQNPPTGVGGLSSTPEKVRHSKDQNLKAHPLFRGPWVGSWTNPNCDSLDVCIDSTTIHLLIGDNGPDGKSPVFRHTRSDDGGKTWSPPVAVSEGAPRQPVPHHRGSDAALIARGDNLFAAWTTPGTGFKGTGPMGTALSTDGGKTWRPGPDPSDLNNTGSHRFLALTATDKAFHLVWLDDRDNLRGLRHASSTDGGKTWSANVTIDEFTCACCWNTIIAVEAGGAGRAGGARGAGGDSINATNAGESSDSASSGSSRSSSSSSFLLTLYRDMKPSDMGIARSVDGGMTWEKLGHVGSFGWEFNGCPHVGGGLALAQSPTGEPQLLAAVWTGMPGRVGCHLLASDLTAKAWMPIHRLGDDTARHPTLAASGKHIAIGYDDLAGSDGASPSHGTGDDRATFVITTSDGGKTWSKPRRLSSDAKQGTHVRLIANPVGGFLALWTESVGKESPVLRLAPVTQNVEKD